MTGHGKIKVLVVDDSALMRQLLSAILAEDPAIEVVGAAVNPLIAREKIKALKPDVLTLDVEMPGMDGITFLQNLMRLRPMPVVMVSSLTEKGADATLRALALGAVDFVTKPQSGLREGMQALVDEICGKVRAAARAHVRSLPPIAAPPAATPAALAGTHMLREQVVVMGASTGGTQAITEILTMLPEQCPGIAIVQHMPPKFTALFAGHLDQQCALEVREARDGERLGWGVALIAPGGRQMELVKDSDGYAVRVYDGAPVNMHRPSVDVLFESAARCAGRNALGIILTGMGGDGARGLRAMKEAGAHTIAQDEATSVIFGMPEQAIRLGGAREVARLERIAGNIVRWVGIPAQHEPSSGTDAAQTPVSG
ncbi:MAG: chemotaxis response regulator protein-glutamate methylesterase [Candidatus Muproteobacteria bacterium RIFCSPHIGHO2_01_FULL_65_16]|uniref:Protein-glutamate methylesterase/protein-glutamine glutaminase n=1 Tax=Candidatus Muproteobacteria bacterium RIFCSPHIGHO2_01_FULL_65_16 TaxID=1817764 RepID=A0A1F6TI19_9PROT|nr:MAG: chemotaxis response regulator protein-glutamate methylesterase [Candidatus Muproteobacteria bacterium RIFCSPHIGHO2_01_FULL_65_16]